MFTLSSRSATILVIFTVSIVAFCLASVFGAMTGTISILPNGTDNGGVLDNLSAITEGTGDTGNSYGNQHYDDYSSSSQSSHDSSNVETTTDNSGSDSQSSSSSNGNSRNVETTTDNSGSSSQSSSSGSGSSSSSQGSGDTTV